MELLSGHDSRTATQRAMGPSGPGKPTSLCGRRSECDVLDGLVDGVRGTHRPVHSAVLVIRGEAGIGKTALLDYAVDSAPDLRVVRARGVESERELAFAALHQLCGPWLDRLGDLPGPQREAMETVFGIRAGPAPDHFLVGLAVLTLVSEVAAQRPLACVVDDAQWLDQASAQALAFAARRLRAEPVVMMFATREPGPDLRGLPELPVAGLPDADARTLLSSLARWPLDERVAERVVAETRGNPQALAEVPHVLSPTGLGGSSGGPDVLRPPGRATEGFLRQMQDLPGQTRLLLLVAAAEPAGNAALVWRAARRLGVPAQAARPATESGLAEFGARVRFRDPVVRSAVYRSAPLRDRQNVHGALAEVTDPQADPDRRAWHLAEATAEPDDDVAAELERSAGQAQSRGGLAAAAAFLERSANLTVGAARRVERMLAAAQSDVHVGAFDQALGLLAAAESEALDELGYARVDLLRGRVGSASRAAGVAPARFLTAARRLEPLDLQLSREAYLDAWGAALFTDAGQLLEVSAAARVASRPAYPPGPPDLLLDGLALLITEGRAAATPTLRRAVSAFRRGEVPVQKGLQWGALASWAAVVLWDFESWQAIISREAELARGVGALAVLPIVLNAQGIAATWCGDPAAATSVIAEAEAVAGATGTRVPPCAAMLIAACRGHEAEALALIGATIHDDPGAAVGFGAQYTGWMTAVLYNGLGRYEDALAAAWRASPDTPEPVLIAWAVPELIEAALRSGKPRVAADALERLAETTKGSDADWAAGIEARSRALLSDGEAAEGLYREAVDRLGRTPFRPDLARARLLYGEWLRRGNRRVDARQQLRGAHEALAEMGMDAFAARARRELLATGETVRKRSVEAAGELTAQEAQIARLACDGLSNPEISTQLFISARTVEWHLRKVFAKLGIRSRRQLRGALPAAGRRELPA